MPHLLYLGINFTETVNLIPESANITPESVD